MTANLADLTTQLVDADEKVRRQAAEQLAQLGPDAQAAAVHLVGACADPSEEVVQWAAAALEEVGPPRASDVGALAALAGDANADAAYWAVTLLGRLEQDAAPSVAALAAALSPGRPLPLRQRSAWALGKIGPPAAASLDALRLAVQDADPRLARLANAAIDEIAS